MQTTSVLDLTRRSRAGVAPSRRFYTGIGVLMAVTAITGFWATYFGPLVRGTLSQPLLIHIHAAVFVGWLALFLGQAALAATRNVVWHLKLGRFGIGYGLLVIVVGLFTGISRSADRMATGGDAEQLLYIAILDILLFSVFFASAIRFRRQPQLHKRLMLVAATILLVAAVFRLPFLPAGPIGVHARLVLWAVPILLAITYDFRTGRSLHPVYALGLLGLLVRNYTVFLSQTDVWSVVTESVTALVL
jgi:hypothetical protein